eukprot:gene21553-27905_t
MQTKSPMNSTSSEHNKDGFSIFGREGLAEADNLSVLDGSATGGGDATVYMLDLQAKYEDAQRNIKNLRLRLVRRTEMISNIRSYYLRDVVTIKLILNDLLSDDERHVIMQQYMERLPSVDLKQALRLHAPQYAELQITPCEQCGGKMEVVLVDSADVQRLNEQVEISKERESRFRGTLANLDAKLEDMTREKQKDNQSHQEEKKVLYSEMRKIKEENHQLTEETKLAVQTSRKFRTENESLKRLTHDSREIIDSLTEKLRVSEEAAMKLRGSLHESQRALKDAKADEKLTKKELKDVKAELEALNRATSNSLRGMAEHDLKLQIQTLTKFHAEEKKEMEIRVYDLTQWKLQAEEQHAAAIATYQERIDKLTEDMQGLQAKTTKQQAELNNLGAENKKLLDIKSELSAEVAELLVDIAIIGEKLDILQHYKHHELHGKDEMDSNTSERYQLVDKLRATIHSLKEELQESEDEIEWLDRALMELQQQHALTQLQLQQQQQNQLTSTDKNSAALNVPGDDLAADLPTPVPGSISGKPKRLRRGASSMDLNPSHQAITRSNTMS